jgi:hypothetical protein
MAKPSKKLTITRRAILQRINRRLAGQRQQLKVNRGQDPSVGKYFIVDARYDALFETDVDLMALAKRLDVIEPYEQLAEGEED